MTNHLSGLTSVRLPLNCSLIKAQKKEALIKEPILRFPDPKKPYTLYTDASKYAWSCVLTQQYTHDIDNKQIVVNHPITYISGLFKGSQLNWAALTKEAYAIYMSIKKLTYWRMQK